MKQRHQYGPLWNTYWPEYEPFVPDDPERPIYAEHCNTLARSGTPNVHEVPNFRTPKKPRVHVGLDALARPYAERAWANLPDWDALARETNRALRSHA